MSDSSKYVMQAATTLVAAKIAAGTNASGGQGALDIETEFFDTYRAVERAMARLGVGGSNKSKGGFNPNDDDEPMADVHRSV